MSPEQAATREGCVRFGASELRSAGVDNSRREAEILLCHVLGVARTHLLAHPCDEVGGRLFAAYLDALRRRAGHEPLPYIVGRQPFLDFELDVGPGVLIPRPETELLVEESLHCLPAPVPGRQPRFVDVGAGSGAVVIGVVLARPDAAAMATEISPKAASIARGNIARLAPGGNINVLEGSLLEPVDPAWRGQVDVIASNPPYIPSGEIEGLQPEVSGHEPRLALDGGPDGLDVVRRLAASARSWLRPGGWLLCEVAMGQACAAASVLAGNGLDSIRLERDLAGIERVVIGQRPDSNRPV